MATRVILNGNQGMRLHSKAPSILSDDEDGVQSGSATGFSDETEDVSASNRVKKPNMAFDPVTQILDKIDAELSSLTRSQASSTATDSTVVRRPTSHLSSESSSRMDNGDSLTMSQLGSTNKSTFSPMSSGSRAPGSTDRDTGIGTATSSFTTEGRRSRSVDNRPVRDLEPGDAFKHQHARPLSPDFSYMNGHHIGQSDDDKSKRESQTASPFEAKQVDDKFKEILQKRKGGFLNRAPTDDDNQTIRTEDFVDKFQDTLVYTSADEAEKIRNLEDDLHSDGGSDTDTLQQKLATLTSTPLPMKVGGPGTPPVYPKPTPTSSLPRPSTRSSLKFTPGHGSDADSVRTEDFENRFKDMMIGGNNTGESDLDTATTDPIHTKVKQLLKATAKYKPKPDFKSKPHVTISPKPPQYQDEDNGDDSDDTLTSEKDARVPSPRSWSGLFWKPSANSHGLGPDFPTGHVVRDKPGYHSQVSNSSSFDESLSKSSLSISSVSSSDKEKLTYRQDDFSGGKFVKNNNVNGLNFSRQVSQISSAESTSSFSDYPETSNNNSRSESTSESLADEGDHHYLLTKNYIRGGNRSHHFPGYQTSQFSGAVRRRSVGENLLLRPYSHKKFGNENMKNDKKKDRKARDLIVQDDEEEEYPFSKYTFNKKANGSRSDDSSSIKSSVSQRSASRDSICSTGVMNQLLHLKKGGKRLLNNSSSNSLFSSLTSSINETSGSSDDYTGYYDPAGPELKQRQPSYMMPQISNAALSPQNSMYQDVPVGMPNFPGSPYGYASPGYVSPTPGYQPSSVEQVLNNLGFSETHSFLPERFLKSWMDKVYLSQQEEFARQMIPSVGSRPVYRDQYSYPDDHDLPPSVSAQQSGASTPKWRTSFENYQPAVPVDAATRVKRQQLKRANTVNNSGTFSQSGSVRNSILSMDDHGTDNMYPSIGPLPLQKENSFDKLKRILQSKDRVQYRERDARRSAFGSNRQNSLPIFLETLSEEEEEKRRSRTPSIDKSKVSRKSPKLLNPADDPERGSKSSEDNSDASRRSSLNQGACVTEMLMSVRKSLSTIESDSENSLQNSSLLPDTSQDRTTRDSKHSIPSIYISGKDNEKNDDVEQNNDGLCDSEAAKLVKTRPKEETRDRSRIYRPKSPTPIDQVEELASVSKDSLEIAEIFSPKDKKVPSISVLKDSFNQDNKSSIDFINNHTHLKQTESSNYLKISDVEEKYLSLSPTPSTASPISPITVIELNKLDHQNDSVEFEEICRNSTGGKYTGRSAKVQTADNKSMTSAKESRNDKRGSPRQKSISPHSVNSLVLERRSYIAEPNSDSDKNLSEENLEIDEETRVGAKSVQADLEDIAPLIRLSDVSSMLKHLLRKLPQQRRDYDNDLFCLVQDKEIQCDIITEENCSKHNESKHFVTILSPIQLNVCSRTTANSHYQTVNGAASNECKSPTFMSETCKKCGQVEHHDPSPGVLQNILCEEKQKDLTNTVYKSEAYFILDKTSSDYNDSEMDENVFLDERSKRIRTTYCDQQVDTFKGETKPHVNDMKTTLDTGVCKIVTVTPEDVNSIKDNTETNEMTEEKTGFEEMVKSYITYCKQSISETPGELKSPNSLTVERFEYEPWDALDLKKVVGVLERKEIASDIDREDNVNEFEENSHSSDSSLIEPYTIAHVEGVERPYDVRQIKGECNSADAHTCSDMNAHVKSENVNILLRNNSSSLKDVNQQNKSCTKHNMQAANNSADDNLQTKLCSDSEFFNGWGSNLQRSLHETEGNDNASYDIQRTNGDTALPQNNTNVRMESPSEIKYTSKAAIVLQGSTDFAIKELKNKEEKCSDGEQMNEIEFAFDRAACKKHKVAMEKCKEQVYRNTVYLDLGNASTKECTEQEKEPENVIDNAPEVLAKVEEFTKENRVGLLCSKRNMCDSIVSDQRPPTGTFNLLPAISQLSIDSAVTTSSSMTINSTRATVQTLGDTHTIENCTSSDDQMHSDQETHQEDKYDFIEKMNKSSKSSMKRELGDSSDDIITEKLISRSLDFDTFDTRKHILKRCNRTTFSRSFDLLGSMCDTEFIDSDGSHERIQVSRVKDNLVELEYDYSEASLDETNDCATYERETIVSTADQTTNKAFREENIQYQLGLKYDDDGNCVDVYGRLRVVKSDTEVSETDSNDIGAGTVNFDENNQAVAESTQYLRQNVFDMFAQIDEDEEGGKILSETDKTLKELEKLYKMSVDDDYMYHDNTYKNNVTPNGMASRRQSYSSILEELDHEIRQMESYHERFQYYETHVCKNCGHSITITTTDETEGDIKHDFCRECSPLDLTAEMLEKRRIQKMQKNAEAAEEYKFSEETF